MADNAIVCRFCGGKAQARTWGATECAQCGSVCAIHRPTQEELDRHYSKFNANYKGGGRRGDNNLLRYATSYLEVINSLRRNGDLIDIGSSTNPLPQLASSAGYKVTVVDYVRPKGLPSNVRFIQGNLDDPDLERRIGCQFDLVTMFAVIEHCPDISHAINTLVRLCRPSGYVVFTTPEIGSFATSNALGRSGWWFWPQHLNLVSKQAITHLMGQHDCQLLYSRRFELNPMRWLARYGIGIVEGIAGLVVRTLSPTLWYAKRETAIHRFKGIALYVFRRLPGKAVENKSGICASL